LGVDHLKYATSDQALEDVAHFLKKFVEIEKFKHPKIVILGCSYPGTLSSRFRQLYPNMSQGAISSSAPQ
jgi:hypothetical protein